MGGIVFLLLLLWPGGVAGPQARSARLQQPGIQMDPGGGAFRVTGWAAARAESVEWDRLLAVYVEPRSESAPALLGVHSTEDGELVFRPRFPLQPGLRYRAVFRPPGAPVIEAIFEIPKRPAGPLTKVEQVYPTAGVLPENVLKLYIHFSAPMSRGEAFQRIHLLDEQGRPVELPFLELAEELWDREWKRLTVLFDPGRIKRGLTPNREVGPPIAQGRSYTLLIDAGWLDARGNPLANEFRKSFQAGPPDRRPVDLKTWRITPPRAGTAEALVVVFPKPMDHALLDRLIEVVDPAARPLGGTIQVEREETRWRFTPERPWKAGVHRLRVGTALEDVAGNKVDRAFDVDVFDRVEKGIRKETKTLPFTVKSATGPASPSR